MFRILSALVLTATAATSYAAPVKWNLSTEHPDGNYITVTAKEFAADVARTTKGELDIKVHSASALFKRPDVKRAVQTGQIQAGDVLISALGNEDPIYEVDSVPLLARTYDDAEKLWLASKPIIAAKLEKQGIKLLYSVPLPPQSIYTKKPINSLSELKGLRFRAYNAATSRLVELMGAIPTTIAPGEVPQAFGAGMIEAMITSPATGVDTQAWDFSKQYYDVKAFVPKNFIMMNARAFNSLPEASRKAVMDASARAEKSGWKMARDKTTELVQTLEKNGMKINPASPAMETELAGIGKIMREEWLKKAGDDGRSVVDSFAK